MQSFLWPFWERPFSHVNTLEFITELTIIHVQKLIRMNQPLYAEDNSVHFKTTLFALIRESLQIKVGSGGGADPDTRASDLRDSELREHIRLLWPKEGREQLNLLVPSKKGV